MIYHFGDIELDTEVFSLRRHGQLMSIEPRVLDVVLYLVEQRARMVSKDELLRRVWNGQTVVPSVLSRAICIARRTLGGPEVIRTIHTRGYQWAAEITEAASIDVIGPVRALVAAGASNRSNSRECT